MKGTVYIIGIDGVPRGREVLTFNAALTEGIFRGFAVSLHDEQKDMVTGERLEFGPIGEPWGVK